MAVDYGQQVQVIIFYQDDRRLEYTVDIVPGVMHADILSDAVASATDRARRQFDPTQPVALLDFVVIAATPGQYRKYLKKADARKDASLVGTVPDEDGYARMAVTIHDREVRFPAILGDMAQSGICSVFAVEAGGQTYLLEAGPFGISLVFVGADACRWFLTIAPGDTLDVLPTGEVFEHVMLAPGISLVEALRPLLEELSLKQGGRI